MWCSHCQQDVPGIASHGNQPRVACARCGDDLSADSTRESKEQDSEGKADVPIQGEENMSKDPSFVSTNWRIDPMPIDLTLWPIDEQLQEAERLIRSASRQASSKSPSVDPPHAAMPSWHVASLPPESEVASLPPPATSQREDPGSNLAAWICLSLGLMGTVCGGVLLGWSIFGARPDLWNLGLPILLAGQTGLILGFVLQLEGLGRSSRHTTDRLGTLDKRLGELHHTASQISATHIAKK